MALFNSNKPTKEEKQQAKADALLERYGLENVSDPQTIEALKDITRTMSANRLVDLGTAMAGTGVDTAKLTYLRALVEQNFIIIRQLDKLIK